MRFRARLYGPLLFAALNGFSQEIDKPAHLWSWADNKDTDQQISPALEFYFDLSIVELIAIQTPLQCA